MAQASRMIRKQIYIESDQDRLLKRLAAASHMSEAEIIRQSVARFAGQMRHRERDATAWQRQLKRLHASLARGPLPGHRSWARDDLYEDRLSRMTRSRSS